MADEVRADEPGAAADEQLHAVHLARWRDRRRSAVLPRRAGRGASGRSEPSTLYAGRGAGRGNCLGGRRAHAARRRRRASKISTRRSSYQEHVPAAGARGRRPVSRRSAIVEQRGGEVAGPRRAADLVGRRPAPRRARAARRSIVSTKFGPPAPNSHAVRTIAWSAVGLRRPRARRRASCGRRRDAGRSGRTRRRARVFVAVEDVVGRDVHDRGAGARPRRARRCPAPSPLTRSARVLVGLGAVDVRARRAVDDGVGPSRGERRARRRRASVMSRLGAGPTPSTSWPRRSRGRDHGAGRASRRRRSRASLIRGSRSRSCRRP